MKKNILMKAVVGVGLLLVATEVSAQQTVGKRSEALADEAWEHAQWISVVDAPVVTERADKVIRAADGASWFVATVKNSGQVKSAR